jgi:rhodanese-related sulfurtransferase
VTGRPLESLLAEARAGLTRLDAAAGPCRRSERRRARRHALADEQREQQGLVPGALRHPLSVVVWRLDELPRDTKVILICREGYSSILAAARLQELGFRDATDVEGGFEAWAAAGLPVAAVGPDR